MKENGNNRKTAPYYIGLDVGTNSVGWAVTDKDYNIIRLHGNAAWGVRLFEEAKTAAERRGNRTARRRLERRKQRLLLLELLFSDAVAAEDPLFFERMRQSSLYPEDKASGIGSFSLFNDPGFTDKDYHRRYPTVYHLRSALLHGEIPETATARLVYLACHHIMKSRGHFLYNTSGDGGYTKPADALRELNELLQSGYEMSFVPQDEDAYIATLLRTDIGITAKKKALRDAMGTIASAEELPINMLFLSDMLSGAKVALAGLFNDEALKTAEITSVSLKSDLEADFDKLESALDDRVEVLLALKTVFDSVRLSQILGNDSFISDAKIRQYNKNRSDLKLLKELIKTYAPDEYREIFTLRKDKLNNYPAYCRNEEQSGAYHCKQDDFCKYIKAKRPKDCPEEKYQPLYELINNEELLPKLRGSDNGVIPYQLHRMELAQILRNAAEKLPFLNRRDADGLTVSEKILSVFDFRIPYYVGPLNNKSPKAWVVRTADKIYPWNFDAVVDRDKSAEGFMINLIGRCTYTGDPVLPKNSLLYSEFTLLNELNNLRLNGKPLPVDTRNAMIRDLFVNSGRKVTKKSIFNWLRQQGLVQPQDELSGVDDTIKSSLKSLRDFNVILQKTDDRPMVENIIRAILVYGEDKKLLRSWLKKNTHGLDEKDFDYIGRLKYADWGRLSKTFLTDICMANELGEAVSIMDMLRGQCINLMQVLSDEYEYAERAEAYRRQKTGSGETLTQRLSEMYIAPSVRRSIRQTLRIVDELVDTRRAAPEKIFIEVARGSSVEMKNKRTVSRRDALKKLYEACKGDARTVYDELDKETDDRLRRDKLYLYYTQLGRCMYSGEVIDLEALLNDSGSKLYDIDHIFPRSRVKDDSLDNRVLVKANLNREKTNEYPIKAATRQNMYSLWTLLHDRGLISDKKFERLKRNYPLTDKELHDFVQTQLVETRQSTKALATLLKEFYPNTKLVYSKAGNVSDFRQKYEFLKCREVNDLHHAKDAYLNIVVGNVYDTKFTANFFRNIHTENYSLNRVFDFPTAGAWEPDITIATVRKFMAKNNILFTRMPREVKGALYDLQLLSAGKGQLPAKTGRSVEKYGGYNKLTTAYFFVVEHTDKKKRVRSIEAVLAPDKQLYESDPQAYCRVHGLVDAKIIVPKIRVDALMELDGVRFHISGRQSGSLLYKHAHQLAIDYENEQVIREMLHFVQRCENSKEVNFENAKYGLSLVTSDNAFKLYEWFKTKIEKTVYGKIFPVIGSHLKTQEEKFKTMDILEQSNLILEILKSFKCDAQSANLSNLCGVGRAGIITKPTRITNLKSAYLINQSVTGLYEERVSLL